MRSDKTDDQGKNDVPARQAGLAHSHGEIWSDFGVPFLDRPAHMPYSKPIKFQP